MLIYSYADSDNSMSSINDGYLTPTPFNVRAKMSLVFLKLQHCEPKFTIRGQI